MADDQPLSFWGPAEYYEVGWRYPGFPDTKERVDALNECLDLFGRDASLWWETPMIVINAPTVVPDPGDRTKLIVTEASWSVYGRLKKHPGDGAVAPSAPLPWKDQG